MRRAFATVSGRTICLSFVLLVFSSAASAQTPPSWRARYDRLEHAFSTKDIKALGKFCAPEMVWVTVDGQKKDRKATLAEFEGMFQADRVKVKEKILSVRRKGDTVELECEVFAKISVKGKPDTRMHSFCTDTWRRSGGQWRMVRTQDKTIEVTGG